MLVKSDWGRLVTAMKYVMFTNRKTGLRMPVFSSDSIPHCDISIGHDWVPTSAGFYDLKKCVGYSSSLELKPAADDETICGCVVSGLESMIMLCQDPDAALAMLHSE
jgi:hypothetical protein